MDSGVSVSTVFMCDIIPVTASFVYLGINIPGLRVISTTAALLTLVCKMDRRRALISSPRLLILTIRIQRIDILVFVELFIIMRSRNVPSSRRAMNLPLFPTVRTQLSDSTVWVKLVIIGS